MSSARRSTLLLIAVLACVGLVFGRLLPPITVRLGGSNPHVGWSAALALFFAALVVGGVAWSMWQAVHRRRRQISSDHGVRMLALAKSGVFVGALSMGGYAGYALAFIAIFETELGRDRVLHGAGAALAGALLLGAGLLLERACLLPEDDDEDDDGHHGGNGNRSSPDPSPA